MRLLAITVEQLSTVDGLGGAHLLLLFSSIQFQATLKTNMATLGKQGLQKAR
jgi:hypothetical protein